MPTFAAVRAKASALLSIARVFSSFVPVRVKPVLSFEFMFRLIVLALFAVTPLPAFAAVAAVFTSSLAVMFSSVASFATATPATAPAVAPSLVFTKFIFFSVLPVKVMAPVCVVLASSAAFKLAFQFLNLL